MDIATQTHLTTLRNMLLFRRTELRAESGHAGKPEESAELSQVEQALRRLDEGVYGDCVECGAPIAFQHLLAQPMACRCVACQHIHEAR